MQINNRKRVLPHNYAKEIAEKLGVSKSLVYSVRMGKRKNEAVRLALIEIAQNHQSLDEKFTNIFAEV